jgi:hypothetical protein
MAGFFAPPPRRVHRRRPAAFRPNLQVLEDRCVPTGTITGTLFEDVNGNGARDGGEPALAQAGVTVYLDLNHNQTYDAGETTTTTDGTGGYAFTVSAGTYAVGQLAAPSGFLQTAPVPSPGPGVFGDVVNGFTGPADHPKGLAWANGAPYLNSGSDSTIYRLDPATGTVLGSFPAPQHANITYDGANFWGADYQADNFLTQFNASGTVLRQLAAPVSNPFGLAWDGQALWVSNTTVPTIYRIDPSTGAVLQSFAAPEARTTGLAFDGTHLWAQGWDSGLTYELDPVSGAVLRSFGTPSFENGAPDNSVTFDGQCLWTAQNNSPAIYRVDISRPGLVTVTVADNQTATADFGDFRFGSISGRVFNDLNANGVQDTGEPGLEGWVACLDTNGNGVADVWERSAVSDASGNYTIAGVRPGTCTVAESVRAPGWTRTAPASGSYSVAITSSNQAVTGRDFGDHLSSVGPVGPETRVNVTTAGAQSSGGTYAVSSDGHGNFVVAWQGNGPGDPDGIFARLYGPDGQPRTSEFRVNTTTSGSQGGPMVAMAGNGSFVVAWTDGGSVFAQRYNAAGTPQGSQFAVFSQTRKNSGVGMGIAADAGGNFAVLYATSPALSGPKARSIVVQRYSATGAAQGKAIDAADITLINGGATLAMSPGGSFVVTWGDVDLNLNTQEDIFAQRFSSTGSTVGGRMQVTSGSLIEEFPSVAMDGSGNFVITWSDRSQPGRVAQIFNADGTRRGSTFMYGVGTEFPVPVAFDASGIVLGWDGVFARRYTTAGVPVDAQPFMVNTTLTGTHQGSSVALTGGGGFVIAWSGNGVGDDSGVFLQRYSSTSPLQAQGGARSTPAAVPLTTQQLRPIIDEAIRRWGQAGVAPALVASLRLADVRIADLPGAELGRAWDHTIWIDPTAAGWGWFVDPTPRDDSEFVRPGDQGEQGRMDLLTAVMHEMGHLLGFEHTDGGLMAESLAIGTRENPAGDKPVAGPAAGHLPFADLAESLLDVLANGRRK